MVMRATWHQGVINSGNADSKMAMASANVPMCWPPEALR